MTYELTENDTLLVCKMCGHESAKPKGRILACPGCLIIHSELEPDFINAFNRVGARTAIDEDYTHWAQEQWALLCQRKVEALDLVTLVDEFSILANSERDDLERTLKRILWSLLKLKYATGRDALKDVALCDLDEDTLSLAPEWEGTPYRMRFYWWAQRVTQSLRWLTRILKASPSLRDGLSARVERTWESLRLHAEIEWSLENGELEGPCPWTPEIVTCSA
jgi:hypothetical protein